MTEISSFSETECDTLLRYSCGGVSLASLIWSEMPGLYFAVHHAGIVSVLWYRLPCCPFHILVLYVLHAYLMYSPVYISPIPRESHCSLSKYQLCIGKTSTPCFSFYHKKQDQGVSYKKVATISSSSNCRMFLVMLKIVRTLPEPLLL